MARSQIWVKNLDAKKQIRKEVSARRQALSDDLKCEYSRKIIDAFVKSRAFQQADVVFCYVSTADEVSTNELLEYSWKTGKRVAVPKVLAPHEMEFYEIHGFEELRGGFKGILEPEKSEEVQAEYGIVIVPGVAFDGSGKRLGYGGGFYDTYLQKHPEYKKAAFAFSMQMIDEIPAESHDVGMEYIYTEKGVYRIW